MKTSALAYPESASSAHSHTHSEVSDSEQSSRALSSPPYSLLSRRGAPQESGGIVRRKRREIEESSSATTQSPLEGAESPAQPRPLSSPYTSFTESLESKASEVLSTDREAEITAPPPEKEGVESAASPLPPCPILEPSPERDHTPEVVSEELVSEVSEEEGLEGDDTLVGSSIPLQAAEGEEGEEEGEEPPAADQTLVGVEDQYQDELQDELQDSDRYQDEPRDEYLDDQEEHQDDHSRDDRSQDEGDHEYSLRFEPDSVAVSVTEQVEERASPTPDPPETPPLHPDADISDPHTRHLEDEEVKEDHLAYQSEGSHPHLGAEPKKASIERSDSDRSDSLSTPSMGGATEDLERFHLGQLVLIDNKIQGVVRFVGHTHFASGVWVGVEIGVPKGRNDGSIGKKRYFQCPSKYGLFVPPRKLTVVGEEEEEEVGVAEGEGLGEDVEMEGPPPKLERQDTIGTTSEEEEEEEEEDSDRERGEEEEEEERGVVPRGVATTTTTTEKTQEDSLGEVTEEISAEEEEEEEEKESSRRSHLTGSSSDQLGPAPASPGQDTCAGEKPDSLPLAPEVTPQRSQSATPTPAPPPEFAEGASRESSMEPPASSFQFPGTLAATMDLHKMATPPNHHGALSERLSEEMAQDLTNEAYEAMHKIWRAKRQAGAGSTEEEEEEEEERAGQLEEEKEEKDDKVGVTTRERGRLKPVTLSPVKDFGPMSLEKKADLITDQLLALLLEAESNLACDIHAARKSYEEEEEEEEEATEERVFPENAKAPVRERDASPEKSISARPHPIVVATPTTPPSSPRAVGEEQVISPTKRFVPPLMINTSGLSVDSTPPLLSPPSPYRTPPFPPGTTANAAPPAPGTPIPPISPSSSSGDFSPPGSPPRHLPQSSVARVAAGERSPFPVSPSSSASESQKALSPPPSSSSSSSSSSITPATTPPLPSSTLERSSSLDSVCGLLDAIKVTTAQCMVSSEREYVDKIVELAWEAAEGKGGRQRLHEGELPECPTSVLSTFNHLRELSPDEEQCQTAYVGLVYRLSLETIRRLSPPKKKPDLPVWKGHCTVRSLLAPTHFSRGGARLGGGSSDRGELCLPEVQKRVYAALMRGQLPNQLPAVKFLNKMRRPGGREIDFVDQILIRELREEEPGWVDYSKDEVGVKEKAADALLESLIDETVTILREIAMKRRGRELSMPARAEYC